MATATKKVRAARHLGRRATAASEPAAIRFLIFEENGGDYRWTILGRGGEVVAKSEPFSSYDAAEQAARAVRAEAASALLEPRVAAEHPVDLIAHREAASLRDDSEAARWLDLSSEAVTEWPAGQ